MRALPRLVALVALAAASGCGGDAAKAKVTGAVTFNGRPVDDGYITFRPADGKGPDVGGPIVSGNYTLSAVPVGPKVVSVSSNAAPASGQPLSSEEASKLRPDPKKAAEDIPPNAKGNNVKVDVKPGEQTFDFAIKSP